jgi:hypothetical protein
MGPSNISACAPYLVLAGDTDRLKDYDSYLGFLAKPTGQFMRVFLVLGNHESLWHFETRWLETR